ncbi:MAG: hypothetical protein ABSH50_05060 [Bryobacteraceae bacterium]
MLPIQGMQHQLHEAADPAGERQADEDVEAPVARRLRHQTMIFERREHIMAAKGS